MAHPVYDALAILTFVFILLLLFLGSTRIGMALSKYLSQSSPTVVGSHIAGFVSMMNYAPDHFYVEDTFPPGSHNLTINTSGSFVFVKGGKYLNIKNIKFKSFKIPFSKFNSTKIGGNCVDTFCQFSGSKYNKVMISKSKNQVEVRISNE